MAKQKIQTNWVCFRDMHTEKEVYIPLYGLEQISVNGVHLAIRGMLKIRYLSNIETDRYKVKIYGEVSY